MNDDVDIQIVEETSVDQESPQIIMMAKLAAQCLTREYPDHCWAVGWAPGMALVIKNLAIDNGKYGFTVDCAAAATISEVEKAVIYGGGELLERCNTPRGRWNGELMHLAHTT